MVAAVHAILAYVLLSVPAKPTIPVQQLAAPVGGTATDNGLNRALAAAGGGATHKVCESLTRQATNGWCTENCNQPKDPFCPTALCDCESVPGEYKRKSTGKVSVTEGDDLIGMEGKECQPQGDTTCNEWFPFQCLEGDRIGACMLLDTGYWGHVKTCDRACLHTEVLRGGDYDLTGAMETWYPGPVCDPLSNASNLSEAPFYQTVALRMKLPNGLKLPNSSECYANATFMAVTLFSIKYSGKKDRMLQSCLDVGVCCLAALLGSDAYGEEEQNLEGTSNFRYKTIAMKPLFIWQTLVHSHLAVVWLDSDMEFRRYPTFFDPGSWPRGIPRDCLFYNFWGNESMYAGNKLSGGSGVMFFNKTERSTRMLFAWAQAMAYGPNDMAPDDQVLGLLVNDDGWMERASYGWLPASYMRMMPAHYHIPPVIEHDRGARPTGGDGLGGYQARPSMPPHAEISKAEAEAAMSGTSMKLDCVPEDAACPS